MKKPRISVAISAYNHEKFIVDVLQSVILQRTTFPFEVIVGDDSSTDATRSLIEVFLKQHPEFPILLLSYSEKLGGARNAVEIYSACQGEYIAHLDGDDLMLPGKLQKQVDFLDANPDCVICAHSMQVIDVKGASRPFRVQKFQKYDLDSLVRNGCFFCHSSKVFRKAAMPIEGFDTSRLRVGDFLWHIQNAQYGKIAYMAEVLGAYRKHTGGASFVNGLQKEHIAGVLEDELYSVDYAERHGAAEDACVFARSRIYFKCALLALQKKELQLFQEYIVNAVLYMRGTLKNRVIYSLRCQPRLLYWLIMPYYFLRNYVFYRW